MSIAYDPPSPDAPAVIHPNEFPVNTQEICYINVSFKKKSLLIFSNDRKISWLFQATSSSNSKPARRN